MAVAATFGLLSACGSQTPASDYKNQAPAKTDSNQKTTGMTSGDIGDTATLKSGGNATVYSYNSPVSVGVGSLVAALGSALLYIYIRELVARFWLGELVRANFQLQQPDNTRMRPDPGWFKPNLTSIQLQPGECARGNVTFQVPQGQRPSAISYSSGGEAAKWSVQ